MTKFNYLSDICGNNKPFTARIRLINNTDVEKGELVYYDEAAFAVTPEKGSRTLAAGVCAEKYKAEADSLVPMYGCGEISVIVSDSALYSVEPVTFRVTAASTDGTVTTDIAASQITESAGIAGSKIVLVAKADDSANTGSYGNGCSITSVSVSGGKVKFATDYEGSISVGDEYAFVPVYGFELLGTDADGDMILQFGEKGGFTVMSANEKGYVIKLANVR